MQDTQIAVWGRRKSSARVDWTFFQSRRNTLESFGQVCLLFESHQRLSKTNKDEVKLTYRKPRELRPVSIVDSNYATDMTGRCSVSGNVHTLGGIIAGWLSKTQHPVTLSVTETEYMSASTGPSGTTPWELSRTRAPIPCGYVLKVHKAFQGHPEAP
jgi:hypothetical protein